MNPRIAQLICYEKQLRDKPTEAEKRFIRILKPFCRRKKLYFKFQQIVLSDKTGIGYVLDFYIPRLRVAFEIDGGYHDDQADKDAHRDRWLARQDIETIHFTNTETTNPDAVIRHMSAVVSRRLRTVQTVGRTTPSMGKAPIIQAGR